MYDDNELRRLGELKVAVDYISQHTANWKNGTNSGKINIVVCNHRGWENTNYITTAMPDELRKQIILAKELLMTFFTRRGFKDIKTLYEYLRSDINGFYTFNNSEEKHTAGSVWTRPAFRVGNCVFNMFGLEMPESIFHSIQFATQITDQPPPFYSSIEAPKLSKVFGPYTINPADRVRNSPTSRGKRKPKVKTLVDVL